MPALSVGVTVAPEIGAPPALLVTVPEIVAGSGVSVKLTGWVVVFGWTGTPVL